MREETAQRVRNAYRQQCHKAAMKYAAAQSGDPFAYRRAMSHMLSGVATPHDYREGGRGA